MLVWLVMSPKRGHFCEDTAATGADDATKMKFLQEEGSKNSFSCNSIPKKLVVTLLVDILLVVSGRECTARVVLLETHAVTREGPVENKVSILSCN
jgi:hypothetical protein